MVAQPTCRQDRCGAANDQQHTVDGGVVAGLPAPGALKKRCAPTLAVGDDRHETEDADKTAIHSPACRYMFEHVGQAATGSREPTQTQRFAQQKEQHRENQPGKTHNKEGRLPWRQLADAGERDRAPRFGPGQHPGTQKGGKARAH